VSQPTAATWSWAARSSSDRFRAVLCHRAGQLALGQKERLFGHLRQRWQDLFGARFEVLLYDLTSTYFESDPPFEETDKRHFGYSRDKRPEGVQVVIGLIVTLKASH